jgi:glutathione synthase/RimK-type ligase-like ATP-grasp enzyme
VTSRSTDEPVPVIVTDEIGSAAPVIQELERRGVFPLVVSGTDLAAPPNSFGVCFQMRDGLVAQINTANRSAVIGAGSRGWRWKALSPGAVEALDADPVVAEMKVRQYRSAMRSLWELPAAWMNPLAAEYPLDQNKTLGAHIARECGLIVPPTLLTNSPELYRGFIEMHRESHFALKAPAGWAATVDDGSLVASYTSRLERRSALAMADAVVHAPVILQPYIEKDYELRVTYVAGRLFACRIDSQSSERTKVDWRLYPEKPVPHTAITLPAELESRLLSFMSACGLLYGTVDLIATPEGEYVFLEVNPSGQYLWIERLCNLPITAAIADWLSVQA